MRQRLGIAQALIRSAASHNCRRTDCRVGSGRATSFSQPAAETASENAVVVLSTHIVSDVSSLCSHLAIIREGQILASTTPRQAINELTGSVWEESHLTTDFKAETFSGDTLASQTEPVSSLIACRGVVDARICSLPNDCQVRTET